MRSTGDSPDPWSVLDPQIAAYVRDVLAPSAIPPAALTVAAARAVASRQLAADGALPEIHSVEAIAIDADETVVQTRVYRPTADARWVIVFFHGGGWVRGDLDTADGLARRLANRSGADVISVDYRLAPEHRFPAAVEDAEAAVRWAHGFAADRPLVVAGESAGGNLAAVCALGRPALDNAVAAQLLVYPVVDSDLTRRSYATVPEEFPLGNGVMGWYWDQYLPEPAARSDPRASPLQSAELGTAAPAVIVLAGQDPLFDEGRAYAAALDRAGVAVRKLEYPGAVHGFLGFPGEFSVRDLALTEACAALDQLVFQTTR